jgi:hypothetical protein
MNLLAVRTRLITGEAFFMSKVVDDFVRTLEQDAEKANTPEGYKKFVQDAGFLLLADPEFAKQVLGQYHRDGAQNKNLPCLSIQHDGAGAHLLVQTFETLRKGACSTSPEFSKATGYYEK